MAIAVSVVAGSPQLPDAPTRGPCRRAMRT
jgi:hypothetical protein